MLGLLDCAKRLAGSDMRETATSTVNHSREPLRFLTVDLPSELEPVLDVPPLLSPGRRLTPIVETGTEVRLRRGRFLIGGPIAFSPCPRIDDEGRGP